MALIAAFAVYYRFLMSGELGEKDVYATLQAAELEGRATRVMREPVILDKVHGSGYVLLGLPTGNERYPSVWIVLNRTSRDGSVFQMPQNLRGSVSCDFVVGLSTRANVENGVLRYLESICIKSR